MAIKIEAPRQLRDLLQTESKAMKYLHNSAAYDDDGIYNAVGIPRILLVVLLIILLS